MWTWAWGSSPKPGNLNLTLIACFCNRRAGHKPRVLLITNLTTVPGSRSLPLVSCLKAKEYPAVTQEFNFEVLLRQKKSWKDFNFLCTSYWIIALGLTSVNHLLTAGVLFYHIYIRGLTKQSKNSRMNTTMTVNIPFPNEGSQEDEIAHTVWRKKNKGKMFSFKLEEKCWFPGNNSKFCLE